MPACSFSKIEFVPMILEFRKPHTLRQRRKHPIKAGDILTLYYKQRTRECRAIALTVCTKVTPVVIYPFERYVKKNGHLLNRNKTSTLAWHDGFDNRKAFFDFFKRYKRPVLDNFDLIEWDTKKFIDLWSVDLFQEMVREMSARERLEWLETSTEIGNALYGSFPEHIFRRLMENEWAEPEPRELDHD